MSERRQSGVPSEWLEGLGRLRVRPVVVLKQGVARPDGQLVNAHTGVVLAPEEAYETVRAAVEEEPLGSVAGIYSGMIPF
jgi:hypothetical protein